MICIYKYDILINMQDDERKRNLKISLSAPKRIRHYDAKGSRFFKCTLTRVNSLIPKDIKITRAMTLIYHLIQSCQ